MSKAKDQANVYHGAFYWRRERDSFHRVNNVRETDSERRPVQFSEQFRELIKQLKGKQNRCGESMFVTQS